jgi:hypothetical protein
LDKNKLKELSFSLAFFLLQPNFFGIEKSSIVAKHEELGSTFGTKLKLNFFFTVTKLFSTLKEPWMYKKK